MRTAMLARALASLPVSEAVAEVSALIGAALEKDAAALSVYGGLIDPRALQSLVAGARARELYEAAVDTREELAADWLFTLLHEDEAEVGDLTRLVHRDLRRLTLGERRALARRAHGEAQKKLLVDPDPVVIANLLANPRTTETLVLAIASHRPTVSAALEVVLNSARFGLRYPVRVALAKNPHLRVTLARNLLVCLDRKDLAEIRDEGSLAPLVRESARRLLARGFDVV